MSKLYHLQWLFWNITLIQFISECVTATVPCLFPAPHAREYILDEAHRPQNKYKDISLPTSLDWRWYKNNTYTSPVKNSLVQNYCGACWAFSTTSTLTDRINIQNGHQFPEWSLSAQTLLDCAANLPNNGCKGGNPLLAYEYIRQNGIATDACSPYHAAGRDTNAKACTASSKCMQCSAHNRCGAQYPYKAWKIEEHGVVEGALNMIFALQDGPIVCGMAVTQDFEALNNFNVYNDSDNDKNATLAVSIVGYGSNNDGTEGSQYWIGRNSWGDYWGHHGYFRIIRGVNNLGIESKCYWAIPESEPFVVNGSNQTNVDREIRDTLTTKIKFDFISAYPAEFSWNNVNGTSYITAVRNQNVPDYCLSDWAFAVTAMMSDRLNVNRAAVNHQSAWPEIIFSVQSLLNVGGNDINANCYGCGDLHSVMKYINAHSVPVESCQLYIGNDASATAMHQCECCSNAATPKICASISNFTAYSFSKWGSITGENDMKQAIYSSGPIVCGMDATPQFKQYTTGIYQQFLFTVTINHYVEIIGWGVEVAPNNVTLEPYWIGKNSWGTYWGEMGLFRIQMKTNNLGIETFCFYGNPQLKK